RPFVAILGGAKVSDKIPVIERLLTKVDTLIIGGGMAFTFFKAQGKEIGDSLLDADRIAFAGDLLKRAGEKLALPSDCVVTDKLDFGSRTVGTVKTVPSDQIPADWEGVDIGPETIQRFSEIIRSARTVVWNGPMGVFEIAETAKGTFAIAEALAEATKQGATTIIGGGDSASAIKQAGMEQQVSHVSTGGGASLEFLEGKALPGVEALTER
ncbi:MAG: phosphoglycerate kinase, partial [Candidatus Latescibacteria bacterium]|nr:phosphoglycerate kinase [Candidatus Latescibacterota bacterium]